MSDAGSPVSGIVKSPGLFSGDTGTGPVCTVGAILLFTLPSARYIFYFLSRIAWRLLIITTFQNIRPARIQKMYHSVRSPGGIYQKTAGLIEV
jgi:K+ transporter